MKNIHLNDFLYFVDDDLSVSELEIRELIRVCLHKDESYVLFKLEDETEVMVFMDGKIEECNGSNTFRCFYTSYKDAVKEALERIDATILCYEDMSKTLKSLMETRKRLQDEQKQEVVF